MQRRGGSGATGRSPPSAFATDTDLLSPIDLPSALRTVPRATLAVARPSCERKARKRTEARRIPRFSECAEPSGRFVDRMWPFVRRNRLAPIERLHDSISTLARDPVLFTDCGVADSFEGRF